MVAMHPDASPASQHSMKIDVGRLNMGPICALHVIAHKRTASAENTDLLLFKLSMFSQQFVAAQALFVMFGDGDNGDLAGCKSVCEMLQLLAGRGGIAEDNGATS